MKQCVILQASAFPRNFTLNGGDDALRRGLKVAREGKSEKDEEEGAGRGRRGQGG